MEYKRFENTIFARLDPGEEITASLLKLAKAENIGCASVSGIGAADDIKVGVFDLEAKKYAEFAFTGNHEITDLCGSLTTLNGEPYQHLHITLAATDGTVRGGHLLSGVISLTGEIIITILPGTLERKKNEALGINTIRP